MPYPLQAGEGLLFLQQQVKNITLMKDFMFYSPTEYVFGRGVEMKTGELAARHSGSRALVVYGGGSAVRSGVLQRTCDSLKAAGLELDMLGGIHPNPMDDKVYEGIDRVRAFKADMIIGVGGGSVIDTAKAIAAGAVYDGDFWDFFSGKKIIEHALPVGVVLTIPAAGSEGSGNSVITKREGLIKLSLRTPYALRPKFAMMNPELTFTLPAYQTAAGATDMMAHVMERYFNNTPATQLTDSVSEAVLRTIVEVTPRVLENPEDYEMRANLMWCGTLAHNGICGTGVDEDWTSHFIEHEISALYGVTHGAGLAVVFPAWQTFMTRHNLRKVAQMAHNVWRVTPTGNDLADALEGIRLFKDFLHRIGMPVTFAELGVPAPDIDALVENLHLHKGNPIGSYFPLTPADTKAIYTLALGDGE